MVFWGRDWTGSGGVAGGRGGAVPAARRGLTLVELMVVILIVMMISAVALPIMSPQLGARQQREAARSLSAFIAGAQARARETGRPAGIWIERFPGGLDYSAQWSINVFYAETPPPYLGEVPGTKVALVNNGTTVTVSGLVAPNGAALTPPEGLILNGDVLEIAGMPGGYRINPGADQQGAWAGPPNNWILEDLSSLSTAPTLSDIVPAAGITVPFRITRQPRKVNAGSLSLPAGTAIDLNFSGDDRYPWYPRKDGGIDMTDGSYNPFRGDMGDYENDGDPFQYAGYNKPVIIMFNPNGTPETVYCPVLRVDGAARWRWQPIPMYTPVYMMVGKIEKIPPEPDEEHNWTDPENMWVAIQPQSGRVTTAEVGFIDPATVTSFSQTADGLRLSRQYALEGLATGGR